MASATRPVTDGSKNYQNTQTTAKNNASALHSSCQAIYTKQREEYNRVYPVIKKGCEDLFSQKAHWENTYKVLIALPKKKEEPEYNDEYHSIDNLTKTMQATKQAADNLLLGLNTSIEFFKKDSTFSKKQEEFEDKRVMVNILCNQIDERLPKTILAGQSVKNLFATQNSSWFPFWGSSNSTEPSSAHKPRPPARQQRHHNLEDRSPEPSSEATTSLNEAQEETEVEPTISQVTSRFPSLTIQPVSYTPTSSSPRFQSSPDTLDSHQMEEIQPHSDTPVPPAVETDSHPQPNQPHASKPASVAAASKGKKQYKAVETKQQPNGEGS